MVTKLNRGMSDPSMHAEYVYRILEEHTQRLNDLESRVLTLEGIHGID